MIPAAKIEAGQLAYDQVAAFAALRRRRMGLIYAWVPVLLGIAAAAAWGRGQKILAAVGAAAALADAAFAAWNWRRLRKNDERNRALLARLQIEHGDELPWLQAERQMAEIRRIQAEEAGRGSPLDEPR